MKLPVFKNLAKNVSIEAMETALEVLEVYAVSPAVKEPEQEVIGEMISNICGAMEMKQMMEEEGLAASIIKFDGSDFSYWMMQVEDHLYSKKLHVPFDNKPKSMKDEE